MTLCGFDIVNKFGFFFCNIAHFGDSSNSQKCFEFLFLTRCKTLAFHHCLLVYILDNVNILSDIQDKGGTCFKSLGEAKKTINKPSP